MALLVYSVAWDIQKSIGLERAAIFCCNVKEVQQFKTNFVISNFGQHLQNTGAAKSILISYGEMGLPIGNFFTWKMFMKKWLLKL